MKIPTRTVGTGSGQSNTFTISTTRTVTYTSHTVNAGLSIPSSSRYWTSNDDGSYTFSYTYTSDTFVSITSISGVTFNRVTPISYNYSISGDTITWTVVTSSIPTSSSGSISFSLTGYCYYASAVDASMTISSLPSSFKFKEFVKISGTDIFSYRFDGNSLHVVWSDSYSKTEPSSTVSWTGYVVYEGDETTYANVYFNGQLVNYVYFNGTKFP